MKLGILSNPHSRANRRHLDDVAASVARRDDVRHVILEDFAALPHLLGVFLETDVDILVINGGDGTVSAALSELAKVAGPDSLPDVAVLMGGTSNTIAHDVGIAGRPAAGLNKLLAQRASGSRMTIAKRRLMEVRYAVGHPPVSGFFFGTAAICDAVMLRRRAFPQPWIPDPVAAAMTLAYILGATAIGRRTVLAPHILDVSVDKQAHAKKPYAIAIATTLRRILLGASPFWGTGAGALQFTTVGSPPQRLLRHAYNVMYGSAREGLPAETYRSYNAGQIQLGGVQSFMLDGEFYTPDDGEVHLSEGREIQFVYC